MHKKCVRTLCLISICDLKAEAQKEFDFGAFNFLCRFLAICSEPRKKAAELVVVGTCLTGDLRTFPRDLSFSRPLGRCKAPIAGRSSSFLVVKKPGRDGGNNLHACTDLRTRRIAHTKSPPRTQVTRNLKRFSETQEALLFVAREIGKRSDVVAQVRHQQGSRGRD